MSDSRAGSNGNGDRTGRFEALLEGSAASELEETFVAPRRRSSDAGPEASLILIAHPSGQALGTRYRLAARSTMRVGRSPEAEICLADVASLSRLHARLTYRSESVVIEDLDSTNGTFVNDVRIEEPMVLSSGDRFQVGTAHFKFLQERDIENAYHHAIHELMILDGLTQIANRRRFEEEAERELGRARRYDRPLSLILFDVDRFKEINDTYGHLCGDQVLKKITELTRPLLRREQVFARVGGEEFAILSPEANGEAARKLAERVRSRFARHEFSMPGSTRQITCSFGVATLGEELSTVQELYEAADRALYRSKNAGRNTVTVWE
jgi:diguanylate cyclase (GGDEF)-like protein